MIAELYPFLADIERDLENPFHNENNPLWGKGKGARNATINATISCFDHQLQAASKDDLAAYAEGLKPHLQKAMTYTAGRIWTDYQSTIADCHKYLSFAFFSLIVREYDRKKEPFIASDYAASAGIEDFIALSSEVCHAANDWGIFHSPTIAQLLAASTQGGRSQGESQQRPKDAILNNATAVSLLKKMQDADKLDAFYQWKGTPTHYEIAAYAKLIADEVGIGRTWASKFADLWPIVNSKSITSRKLTRGLNEGQHSDFMGTARKVLGLPSK